MRRYSQVERVVTDATKEGTRTMALEVDVITLPAFLASALINGDESGLEESDERVLADVYAMLGEWQVVDVVRDEDGNAEEARFTWSYDLHCGDAKGGDVLDYVIHRYI
jgi:hypothetical protein